MLIIHDISWEGEERKCISLTPPNLISFKFVRLPPVFLLWHGNREATARRSCSCLPYDLRLAKSTGPTMVSRWDFVRSSRVCFAATLQLSGGLWNRKNFAEKSVHLEKMVCGDTAAVRFHNFLRQPYETERF